MKSAAILTPPSTSSSSIVLSLKAQYSEGPEYEKYQHYIDARGEILPTPSLFSGSEL